MKTFAFVCSVLLIGALCAVLAGPVSNSNSNEDSASSSQSSSSSGSEENPLAFPPYSILPERVLKAWSDDDSNEDENDSEHPEGRTLFLLFRLYQLLNRLNLTSSG